MKIITTNLIISIVLIVCDRKYFSYPMKLNSLGENNLHSKNIERNMIPTEDHLMLKNSTLINKIDKLTINLTDHNFLTLKNLTRINYEKNQMNETPDPARILYNKIRNKTEHINSNILFGNNTNTIEIISKNLDSSITNLRKFHKTLEEKIKKFEIHKFDEVTSLSSAHCKSKKKKNILRKISMKIIL